MIPIIRPLLVLGLATLAAALADREGAFAPPHGAARWPLFALTSLVVAYLLAVIPAVALLAGVAAMGVVIHRRRHGRLVVSPPLPQASRFARGLFLAVVLLLVLLSLSRPDAPLYWDEFVWLAKARLGTPWPRPLVSAALSPTLAEASPVIPPGYPLFYSLAAAWLGGFSAAPSAVVAGAAVFEALVFVLFAAAAWDTGDRGRGERGAWVTPTAATFVLVASPLVLIHLRATYVDLPLGMLAATLALFLRREDARAAPVVLAVALVGMKDEGLAHVGAVAFVAALDGWFARSLRRVGTSVACLGAAFVGFAAWRFRLASAGVADSHHVLSLPDLARIGPLFAQVGKELVDRTTWGALWILVAGALGAAASAGRRTSPLTRTLALTLIAQATALVVAVLSGPGRVMEFVMGGTLVNRLLVQLAPTGAILVGSFLESLLSARPLLHDHRDHQKQGEHAEAHGDG